MQFGWDSSAVAIPAAQVGLGVDRVAVDADLEVEVAADAACVAGLPNRADALAGPDARARMDRGRPRQVGVEVAAPLPFTVDRQVVAVENLVEATTQHPAAPHRDKRRAAIRNDVEPFVPPAAAPRRTELADRPSRPMRSPHREYVGVVLGPTRREGKSRRSEEKEDEKS